MNKLLTLLAATVLASGCSSTQHVSTFAPAERDLMAKAEYYEDLYQREYRDSIDAVAEVDVEFARVAAETEMLLEEPGWSQTEYDTVISRIRGDDEKNLVFEAAEVMAEAAR